MFVLRNAYTMNDRITAEIIDGKHNLNKPETYTVAYALKMFNDSSMSDYGATFAMSAASLVPILVLFFFFQKNLVEGISIQGLKG